MVRIIAWIVMFAGVMTLGSSMMTSEKSKPLDTRTFNESVNLALRQMGHELLTLCGDDSSTIGSVRNDDDQRFSINLPVAFDYDQLPTILDRSLKSFNISREYQVAIRDCQEENILLGFNAAAVDNKMVACAGREIALECSWVSVSFPSTEVTKTSMSYSGVGLLLLGFVLLGVSCRKDNITPPIETSIPPVVDHDTVSLGSSQFNHLSQKIIFGATTKELTYRESKLLQFLATHQQEVLDRETLVSEVWGSEGVIVGRSLDVFISRLRKILKADPQLEIKNIHGVGYKLIVHDLVPEKA